MKISDAVFISSITDIRKAPERRLPEFAFIGRSNVGKSSLVNMLTGRKSLAKTSGKPGKTQTINHFLINDSWYVVDLPGYGYASTSKSVRRGFGKIIESYIGKSENLFFLFVLIDCRLKPQANDLDFIRWAGSRNIPIGMIYTKTDKLSKSKLRENIKRFENALYTEWSELPSQFVTSATKRTGKNEILDFIENALAAKN
jgi:GTP-binding protein